MTKTSGTIGMDLAESSTVVPLRGLGYKIETAQRSIIAPSHVEGRMQTLAGDALPASRRTRLQLKRQLESRYSCMNVDLSGGRRKLMLVVHLLRALRTVQFFQIASSSLGKREQKTLSTSWLNVTSCTPD